MEKKRAIGGHQRTEGLNDEWLTPPEIVGSLGKFDLDPCAPSVRPWPTANVHYTESDNGMALDWFGRVWLNPPYNRYQISAWLEKMANHGNGITLMFARTETEMFQEYVFPFASSILFIKGRLHFHYVTGERAKANSGAPSVLVAYSEADSYAITDSGIEGRHLPVNNQPFITIIRDPSWKSVITISMIRLNGRGRVSDVYAMARIIAPDKTAKNKHYREKIRQKLQQHFKRIEKGVYTS